MIRTLLLSLTLACGTASAGDTIEAAAPLEAGQAEAVFASGCFWCSEKDFEKVPGVLTVVSGYAGGSVEQPSYELVGTGVTGHTEAIRVVYDPKKVSYADLLDHFWRHVDYTDAGGQFCDRGSQYRPAILPVDDAQEKAAEASVAAVEAALGEGTVKLKVEEPGTFWVAESYHQDFYETNTAHYERYRRGCGRDAVVAKKAAKLEGVDVTP